MSWTLRRNPKVIFIHGATATGKTELALRAVELYGGEIINCDSVQMYKSVNIGAAKPTREELAQAKHHLIDFIPEGDGYTAGQYRSDAIQVIEERFRAGVNVFYVVGGSGFYAQALEKGVYPSKPAPPGVREALAKILSEEGLSALYSRLNSLDPHYAKKIGPNDQYRIVRALEVLADGEFSTMEELRQSFSIDRPNFLFFKVGLTRRRVRLREAVRTRATCMLESGLVDEVRGLREKGLGDWAPLKSVGYKETQLVLDGQLDPSKLVDLITENTMKLAKRQVTWFRREKDLLWFDPDFGLSGPLKYIFECVRGDLVDLTGLGETLRFAPRKGNFVL